MNKFIIVVSFVLFVSGCKDKNTFWPIEQFSFTSNGPQNNEQVRVIYYSGGPFDDQVSQGFYRHAIVISTATNDTFNVLTFPDPALDNLTADNNLLIYSNQPSIKKSIENFDKLPEEMQKTINSMDTTKVSWTKYLVVIRYPEFDSITYNKYKTVIGSLSK